MNSKTNPFLVKAFEASSCHITKEDNSLLRQEDHCSLCVYEVRGSGILYGYLICTGFEDSSINPDEFYKAVKDEGYSDAMINLLKLAKDKGCKFLQLDCDGMQYDDLPSFDW